MEMIEREYIEQCLSYVKIAEQCLKSVPNETWNRCIDLNYPWTKDLCNAYTSLQKVKEFMLTDLNTKY